VEWSGGVTAYSIDGLGDLFEKSLGHGDGGIGGEVEVLGGEELSDPRGEFAAFVLTSVALVGKDHNPVVIFAPHHSPHALRGHPYRIKRQKLPLLDLMLLLQKLQSLLTTNKPFTARLGLVMCSLVASLISYSLDLACPVVVD